MLEKYLPLSSNSAHSSNLKTERQKDHYSHFILRLAFSGTEDLRRRFSRIETALFRMRFQADDGRERQAFVESLNLDLETVSDAEKGSLGAQLLAATPGLRRLEDESFIKVDWERVPDLVEQRKVLLKGGKAYVPVKEQMSLVLAEFTSRLEKSLEVKLVSPH
jgi:DNA primase large subunit